MKIGCKYNETLRYGRPAAGEVGADGGNMGTNGVLRFFCLREKAVSLHKISGIRQYGSKFPLRSFALSLHKISKSDKHVSPKRTI